MPTTAVNRVFRIESSFVAWFSIILLLALFFGFIDGGFHKIRKGRVQAFDTYYGAASALREGGDPYGRIHAYPYVYPPFYAFACQPLARLSRRDAARVMFLINAGLLFMAILASACAIRKRFAPATAARAVWPIALVAALIASFPIYKELRGMQSNSVLLFGLSMALLCLDRRPVLAGCGLAIGIIIKYLPLVALPYLLLRRRWTAAVATVLATIALALLPALSIGWSANLRYLTKANGGLTNMAGVSSSADSSRVHGMTDYLNISVTSTLTRLAEDWGFRESAGLVVVLAVIAFCGGWLAIAYRRHALPIFVWPPASAQTVQPFAGMVGLEWAALAIAAIAFAPNGEMVFAALPASILSVLLLFPQSPRERWMSASALALMLIALMFPISQMGRASTMLWNLSGASCWLLLASFALVCLLTLDRISHSPPRLARSSAVAG